MDNANASTLPAELSSESLSILNVVAGRIQRMLKSRVCELEQESLDLEKLELHALAQVYRDEARVTDLLRHRVSREVTETFLEVLQTLNPLSGVEVRDVREPELPALPRRPYGRGVVVEAGATEVADTAL